MEPDSIDPCDTSTVDALRRELNERAAACLSDEDVQMVERAFALAHHAHNGEFRRDGAPFLTHPIRVAIRVAGIRQTATRTFLCGALLHDVLEDAPHRVTRDDILAACDEQVLGLVETLTAPKPSHPFDRTEHNRRKFDQVHSGSREAHLVKLADRIDNVIDACRLATTEGPDFRSRYLADTIAHYVPLSKEAGCAELQTELAIAVQKLEFRVMTETVLNLRTCAAGIELDTTQMTFPLARDDSWKDLASKALSDMRALEGGAIANPDEQRRVGHYWLRTPGLAPDGIGQGIEQGVHDVRNFANVTRAENRFRRFLVIGIGGSALGPQMICDALRKPGITPSLFSLDNTDPDGIQRVFDELGCLDDVMCIVVSKGGGTSETQNGMSVAQTQWSASGLSFRDHAVAVTGAGSRLDKLASEQGWLATFPIEEWVGGRTSLFSPVGLLPAALLGFDIKRLLQGARDMDAGTRDAPATNNPALLIALAWYSAVQLEDRKNLVILPYSDRLVLLTRYLQQLVMESLGKEGHGITVFGNKGSTDQHSYIQQLREGTPDFTAMFLQPLVHSTDWQVNEQDDVAITAGDYLAAFLEGTRQALGEAGRPSIRLCFERVDEYHLGSLIALFERTVGFYASLIKINAYHQPGVEAGKLAAKAMIDLQCRLMSFLREHPRRAIPVSEIAEDVGCDPATAHDVLRRLAASESSDVTASDGILGYSDSRCFSCG